MNKRTAQSEFQQHRASIRQRVGRQRAVEFFNVLTGPLLLELTEAHLPEHRERLYPPPALPDHRQVSISGAGTVSPGEPVVSVDNADGAGRINLILLSGT